MIQNVPASARKPVFRKLTTAECRALLRENHVGRLAFTFKDRVDIEPISYVFNGRWLYGRTSHGTKLLQLRHHPWIAFEVDEVRGPFDWSSVVVHGTVYFLDDAPADRQRALRLLRTLDPRVHTEDDLVPERTVVFRIHIDKVSGRSASTKPPDRRQPRR